nr:MAG TPA: Receptor Binding Protein [Caudoviricetes sp.]
MSIITYPLDGVTYSAEDVATHLCTRTSGVYAKDSNFAVSITGTRQVTIAPGLAWMNYDDFKGVSVCSREDTVLTVPDADNTLNRVDRVVLQFDTASNLTAIRLKTGTPAVAAQPPDILQNHNQYELGLCTISVPAGSAAISAADVTDTRADEDVCGVMRDGVTGIPTAELVKQWRAVQAAQEADARQQTENQLTAAQQKFDAQMSTMQQQSGELSAEIKKLQDGGFYTKAEADAKFGTPYNLPAATTTTLGGVKLSEDFTADEDGTLHLAGGTAPDPYPVGSIYQSTDPTSPAALFGGTWEEIASDRVLMGASRSHAAGTTVEAGLPNITGSLNETSNDGKTSPFRGSKNAISSIGALAVVPEASSPFCGFTKYEGSVYDISFDASSSNSIYGSSTTVQPAAYYVHIWRRVA